MRAAPTPARAVVLAFTMSLGLTLTSQRALAQVEIRPVKGASAPSSAPANSVTTDLAPLDLGEVGTPPRDAKDRIKPAASTPARSVALANAALTRSAGQPIGMEAGSRPGTVPAGIERVIFDRQPIKVALPVGKERLVTFNQPIALHAPEDADAYLRMQIIGKTAYLTPLLPFGSLRVVAEQLDGEQLQIPIDFVADRSSAAAQGEVQIFGRSELSARTAAASTSHAMAAAGSAKVSEDARGADGDEVSIDAVALTRCAARKLYAPWRLTGCDAAIHQVPVELTPVPDLYRGARVQTTPLGAWRAGALWVTAVRLTNLESLPLEIHLEDLRGQWVTSTAHSGWLGRAGSETDTTALYLVCDRPFEACR